MRAKRKYRRISHEVAVEMIKAFHFEGRTQTDIANERGLDRSHVCSVVHGDLWPAAFNEVFPGAR